MSPDRRGYLRITNDGAKLREAIDGRIAAGAKEIDIAGWMSRTALELVGQGGLGHSFDPLIEETSDEYTEAVKALVCVLVCSLLDSYPQYGWLTCGTITDRLSTPWDSLRSFCLSSSTWARRGCAARCSI